MTNSELLSPLPATAIVDSLPQGDYTEHYQPTYERDGLIAAVHELRYTEPVTTPEQVDGLRSQLADIATGLNDRPIITTGSCAESVELETPVEQLVEDSVHSLLVVSRGLKRALHILRNRGQNTKPRSLELETLPDGTAVASYMGDAVNDVDIDQRTPDPTRMVAAAVQARDLEAGLTKAMGEHVPAAHEALLLPYEHSFVSTSPEAGKSYLLSTDLPWVGVRTNDPGGPHVEMLTGLENPVGVKLGPNTTAELVKGLQTKLNPNHEPGKLVLMLRMGLNNIDVMQSTLAAIKEHAPGALIMYDIHGSTSTNANGQKVRYVGNIISEIKLLATACREQGLKLHGLHLETTNDDSRLECVDEPDQSPRDPGNVDPRLNPRQTLHVLKETAEHIS